MKLLSLMLIILNLSCGDVLVKETPSKKAPHENGLGQNTTQATVKIQKKTSILFKSGFEGLTISPQKYDYQYITGKDELTGYSWPIYILGSDFSGIHRINDDNGKAITNRLEKIKGPHGNTTTALYQEVTYDVKVTQTPYQINNIKQNPKELYIRYWMKTDTLSLLGKDQWRAIWEYKTKQYAENRGFRMIAFMAKDIHGRPFWSFQGDKNPQEPIWQVENYDMPLIRGEWFKVEFYLKWSEGPDGYASMKVNGKLIGEHFGATTHNEDPMDFIMLTQVYGNSHPMYQWVDDIEIWDDLPQ